MKIHCCGCDTVVTATLTDGAEIYPHRPDLRSLPFWRCSACGNYVGCHYKSKTPTKPLGCIPTKELRDARSKVHGLIDPLWKQGATSRTIVYREMSEKLGKPFHSAEIKTLEEADEAIKAALLLIKDFLMKR